MDNSHNAQLKANEKWHLLLIKQKIKHYKFQMKSEINVLFFFFFSSVSEIQNRLNS